MTKHSFPPMFSSYLRIVITLGSILASITTTANASSQFYSPELCCGDVPLKIDSNSRCCGNRSYSTMDSMCCFDGSTRGHYIISFATITDATSSSTLTGDNNAVASVDQLQQFNNNRQLNTFSDVTRFLACCGDELYDYRFYTCCEGTVWKQALSGNTGCCGKNSYDPYEQLCCDGQILQKTTFSSSCCGKQSYDHTKEVCCGEKVSPAGSSTASQTLSCCGSETYVPETQLCCNGIRHTKTTNSSYCCGSKQYDWEMEMCCDDTIYPRMSDTEFCCGQHTFDSATHLCCLDTVIPKKKVSNLRRLSASRSVSRRFEVPYSYDDDGITCCGNTTYNYDREICCDGQVITRDVEKFSTVSSTRCCGKQPYDENKEICCKGQVFPKETRAEDCCGSRVFNVQSQVCCKGVIHDLKPNSLLYCCGSSTFNPQKETCCNGKKSIKDITTNEA